MLPAVVIFVIMMIGMLIVTMIATKDTSSKDAKIAFLQDESAKYNRFWNEACTQRESLNGYYLASQKELQSAKDKISELLVQKMTLEMDMREAARTATDCYNDYEWLASEVVTLSSKLRYLKDKLNGVPVDDAECCGDDEDYEDEYGEDE